MLLLLAGASRWIAAAAHAEAEPTIASEALGCTWAALLSLAFLRSSGRFLRKPAQPASPQASSSPTPSRSATLRCILAGALLFGGPAIGLLLRGTSLDAGSLTIALALTPVVVAIAASALGIGATDGVAGRIWPGLAAVGGLLLVLAQPSLADIRTDLALILAPLLTGLGAALFSTDRPASPTRVTFALTGGAALFALAAALSSSIAHTRPTVSLLAVACDGLLALLGVPALLRLGASRWSSQFTWLPLLIVLQGIVLLRPPLTARWITGLLLLALASVYLLLPQADEMEAATPSILS